MTNSLKIDQKRLINTLNRIVKEIGRVQSSGMLTTKSIAVLQKNQSKIYEVYLYALSMRAIKQLNGSKISISNLKNGNFNVAGNPAKLSSHVDYSYVNIYCSQNHYRLVSGLRFKGVSGATHECDIAIIREDVILSLLASNQQYAECPTWSVECKCRADIERHVSRAALGVMLDLFSRHALVVASDLQNQSHDDQLNTYWSYSNYLYHFGASYHKNILPKSDSAFLAYLKHTFSNIL